MMATLKHELLALLSVAGQEHVLRYWDELSDEQRNALHAQIMHDILPTLPSDGFVHLNNVYRESNRLLIDGPAKGVSIVPPSTAEVTTMHHHAVGGSAHLSELVDRQAGLRAVRAGRCAVVVLAGGAGTRLGQTYPKGMLVCPLLRQHKSLFQLHCEKVRRVEVLAGAAPGSLQICFMTSDMTDKDTRDFFAAHGNFGLQAEQLSFTVQSSLPCFFETTDPAVGKIMLADKHRIAMAPGGNAGVYEALERGGCLAKFAAAGVTHVQIFTVDNILARIADPDFFGFALRTEAEVVVKSTPKAHDHEAVGVFAKTNGKWGVVEYTEIGKEMAEARDETTGERLFNCANIAIHLCSLPFLLRVAEKMRTFYVYHIAKKPIPTTVSDDVQGASRDGKAAGIKMEAFIFDLFQFAAEDSFKIIQVDRSNEFSAIKNADEPSKKDSPTTAVRDLQRLHFNWLVNAARRAKAFGDEESPGLVENVDEATLDRLSASGECDGVVEISPLASYDGENLLEHVTPFLEKVREVLLFRATPSGAAPPAPYVILSPLERASPANL